MSRFGQPARRTPLLHPVSTSGSLGIDKLLEVFLELEQLDDEILRPAVVCHGRKTLQTLPNRGTPLTQKFLTSLQQLKMTQQLERHLI